MTKKIWIVASVLLGGWLLWVGCEPSGEEPQEVALPMTFDASGLVSTTNVAGWQVTVTAFDVCVQNVEFTQEGEEHTSLLRSISNFVVPEVMAHPGHLAGGDVTGTLQGQWSVSFFGDSAPLGDAVLLEGEYNGFNMSFCVAGAEVGVAADAKVFGHHAFMAGIADNGTQQIQFELFVDVTDDPLMYGGVFEMDVTPDSERTLSLRPVMLDPYENDSFFEGVDFGALDEDNDGVVSIESGSAAHNILMKSLLNHDHWYVVAMNE
ncbi:MAG: hypothetical protein JXX29_03870 [Deltaproteobacteria bacterium]|nr:hypothetical protein [Deltaproteobacteria bacterium]MBN2670781.1 hypothetical protein [Deltaproteobacteria bacterium]